uniref:Diacylglycerol kinase 7-like n=1 Tax=Nicotiana tabacum TaxID=4097 RepID=A0A1S4D286_TOBAC|nr:PREDICTED: diacylglycerol kinase 7-like [Nicotiana tabacum]
MNDKISLLNVNFTTFLQKVNNSKWEQVHVPSSVRSIVTLNLPSYGGGRKPWGHLKPEYMEKIQAYLVLLSSADHFRLRRI